MIERYQAPSEDGHAMLKLVEQSDVEFGDAALYSLIDGAKFPGLGKIRLPSDGSVDRYSLLGESAQIDALDVGPVLLRHTRRQRCPVLVKLLDTAGSARFLSVILSDEPLPSLLDRLLWLTDVEHEDGTEWVMRYYDPIILPHWLQTLDITQHEIVVTGISAWLYIGVSGIPEIIRGKESTAIEFISTKPMLMRQNQCDELMNKTLPYMMMHELESDDARALDTLPVSERYDFFAQQLAKAHSYGLDSITDLKTYSMLSLMFGPDFDDHPVAATALQEVGSLLTFSARVLNWTPEQWNLF